MFRSIRMSMLSIGLAAALAALVVLAHALWSFQQLGRSAERALAAKDVVADVLPPPLYLIEMRLVLSQAVERNLTPEQARAEVERLAGEYERRLAYWRSHDAYGLQQQLLGREHASAQRLIQAAKAEVLDRLQAGDREGARHGLEAVQAAYLEHRAAVDATVVAGAQVARDSIADFDSTRRAGIWLMPLIALVLLAAAAWCYLRARRSILRPLRDCVALADRVAAGDLRPAPAADRDDELGRLQSALRDMTAKLALNVHELEQARDAAQAGSQAKADFLANMSHEIRTPMNAVLGLTHLVLRTPLDARQRDYLSKIDEAGQSLLRIINDILDFSKIEAGKLELERAPFELDRLLDQVAQIVGPLVDGKSVELVMQHDEAVPNMLHGDALRVKQVLINLASNAVKFTERGEVFVGIALQARQGDALSLTFTVRDSGIGMSEDEQKRLFEAFVQADSSTSRRFGGTGLGLVISRRLVELMGGELKLRSVKGQGSEFWFTLILQRSSAPALGPAGASTEDRARLMRHRLDGLGALVVDDNFSARMTLASMLRAFGMQVTEADSGSAALAAAHRAEAEGAPFAVALVDWRMPEMDGFVVIDELRGAHPSAQTAFIMVSAYDREVVEREVPQHAPDGLLQKPVTPSTLLDALFTLLTARDAQAADGKRGSSGLPTATMPEIRLAGHVLLVEDNALNQIVASELLRDSGLQVSIANDGPQALQALANGQKIDAVLMDLQMPGMDGFEATRQIRALPERAGLPVIAMTAHAFAGERERCLASGMDDYVSKPIDPALLAACLLRWLPKAR